ncbi:MAG: CoA transferase, partial [Acidimicrobiales bacterium]
MTTPDPILRDVKVLDFTQYVAGPTVTRLMAALGAYVIKVEPAPQGDLARLLPWRRDERSSCFVQHNRGKRSLAVNLNDPAGLELVRDLVRRVDVVVENYGPGVMDRRGLGYAQLRELNPAVIMASVSAFGRTGPLSHRVGYDPIAQAYSGLMHMIGDPDGPPTA